MDMNHMKVGIVGAGIAGLYSALLLQELGIDYEILEASDRIGGRLYTYYFDETKYNYVEIGGMRFPKIPQYDRFMGRQKWSLLSYLNNKLNLKNRLKLIPFVMSHMNNILYFNGIYKYRYELENEGDLFGFGKKDGGFIDDKYTEENAFYWDSKVYDFIRQQMNNTFANSLQYLIENDYQTFRGFMTNPKIKELAFPSDVADWMESFASETGRYSFSLLDVFMSDELFAYDFLTIDGGVSKVIDAMAKLLENKPKLSQRVTKLLELRDKNLLLITENKRNVYTHVIMTPQLTPLRDIEFLCNLQMKKRIAMRTLSNQFNVKVAFMFKTRFWENSELMKGKPIFGGTTITDLRIRQIVYPSYGINCSDCRGALLVSYTGNRDARKFLGYNDSAIIQIMLSDLVDLHGNVVNEQFTGTYMIIDWGLDPLYQGAFSAFDTGNFMSYYPYLTYPELNGRLHFAGDTLSVYHGWIIGSLTSAYRAVKDLLLSNGLNGKIEDLEQKWGTIEEPDFSDYQTN